MKQSLILLFACIALFSCKRKTTCVCNKNSGEKYEFKAEKKAGLAYNYAGECEIHQIDVNNKHSNDPMNQVNCREK